MPRATPHRRTSLDQKSPPWLLVSLAVESLSMRESCPIVVVHEDAVAARHAGVALVGYPDRSVRPAAAVPDAQ